MRVLFIIVLAVLFVSGCGKQSHDQFSAAEKHLAAGRDSLALKEVRKAISKSDTKFNTMIYAVALCTKYNRLSLEEKLITDVLDDPEEMINRKLKDQEKIGLLSLLSSAMNSQGRVLDSIKPLEEALRLSPEDSMMQNNLAYQYAEAGVKLDKALTLAGSAHSALPDNAIVTDTLGWVYYKKGRYADAVRYLEQAVRQKSVLGETGNEALSDLRYHLGAAYASAQKKDKAIIELRKSILLNASASQARTELRKITSHK